MSKLSATAALEPRPESHVFQPAIGLGDRVEIDSAAHRAKGNRAKGVRRAASAAMRRWRADRCVLRVSIAKSSPLLSNAARYTAVNPREGASRAATIDNSAVMVTMERRCRLAQRVLGVGSAALPFLDAHAIDPAKQGEEDDGGCKLLFAGTDARPGRHGRRGGEKDGHGEFLRQPARRGPAMNGKQIKQGKHANEQVVAQCFGAHAGEDTPGEH